jgi:hypothetical protein
MRSPFESVPFTLHSPFPYRQARLSRLNIPGLQTLVGPSNVSTLFQETMATMPVAASGDPTGLAMDISSNGNNFTAPSDAARPTYQTDGGLHWLEADGLDDVLQLGAPLAPMSSFTVVMGLQLDALASGSSGILSAGTFTSAIGSNGNDTFRSNFGYGYNSVTVSPGVSFVATVILEAGVGSRCRVDQGLFSSTPGSGASVAFEFLFARNASASFFQGRGYSLALYNRVLNDDELVFIERAAADEAGVYL